jgi:hypothetical protein
MAKLAAVNSARAVRLVSRICHVAGAPSLIDDTKANLGQHGVITAVHRHDTSATPVIFNFLVDLLKYQGVADSIANDYVKGHNQVRWSDVANELAKGPTCTKLSSFGAFKGCHYRKGPKGEQHSCANPKHLNSCPLPRHDLRIGKLNQNAYSLFLFMRDVAHDDVVGWLDRRLDGVDPDPASDRSARLREALLEPLEHVYGVGKKVLSMALSDLLLAADAQRSKWIEAGSAMIAIDTLVHNFLHRTGILQDFGAEHSYGTDCYAANGCRTIIEFIADKINAQCVNSAFPANFPRFVQHAIWRFCAESGLNRCNGKKIDDSKPCEQTDCPVFQCCARVPLKPAYRTVRQNPRATAAAAAGGGGGTSAADQGRDAQDTGEKQQEEIQGWPRDDFEAGGVIMIGIDGPIEPSGPFEWRWPSGNIEHFCCSWTGEVIVNGKPVKFRHALASGGKVKFGRRRIHSVTWLRRRVMVEGVEADDYAQSRALLSLLKKPDGKLFRTHEAIPEDYRNLSVVAFHEEISANRSWHSQAVKIAADDVARWVTHASIRAVTLGQI